ncbi:MAG: hypothetical protein H7A04_12625 [Pseudomonadales bacterium]|nr:hypothetical protein [Pseudomonadales bacterium]
MNLEKLQIWSGLLANLGVIAGIVFLAAELNQNSSMMAAQTRTNITREIIESMEKENDPLILESTQRIQAGEPLNAEQTQAATILLAQRLRHWENVLYQYDNGLFDDEEFSGVLAFIDATMSSHFAQEVWRQQRPYYSPNFQSFVDAIIEN